VPCHAPGGRAKPLKSQEEFSVFWDELLDVSRAAWEREMRQIARQMWRKLRREDAAGDALSRAR